VCEIAAVRAGDPQPLGFGDAVSHDLDASIGLAGVKQGVR
jgi:hypothetical protein